MLRSIEPAHEILAFERPLAGHQLVQGSIEAGESIEAAALRELAEQAGLKGVHATRRLGTWESGWHGQVWAFVLCESAERLPESWLHHAADDGGHDFRFLASATGAGTVGAVALGFQSALRFIQAGFSLCFQPGREEKLS
jgi:8-oxo-dGTP pyrophosphatase MutT (NUDIX family)